ncbi:hypothetical protein ABF63_20860 [Enterobacter hormaechei subsp. steigerwaltii]|nr:hypothetical protein ABF63_20860 [Enterobacter hormaechei subsp. steigerwaltii]
MEWTLQLKETSKFLDKLFLAQILFLLMVLLEHVLKKTLIRMFGSKAKKFLNRKALNVLYYMQYLRLKQAGK